MMPHSHNQWCPNVNNKNDYATVCKEILRRAGAKITQPRLAVIQCLADSQQALNPREIQETIGRDPEMPTIDQVSVYRILEILQKNGLVHQVFPSGCYIACTHLECRHVFHLLIHCTCCNNSEEIHVPNEISAPLLWYLKSNQNFIPQDHLIQIDGTCSNCLSPH
jgi:Fur family ferric uptake transcriptional regulator